MLTLSDRIRRLLWDPGVLQLVGRMLVLLVHIEDIRAFRTALDEDGFEAAAAHATLSADELEARTERLFRGSRAVAEAVVGTRISDGD